MTLTHPFLFILAMALPLIFPVNAAAQTIILDNDQGSPEYVESGAWSTGSATGYNNGAYRVASAGATGTAATWTAQLPQAGHYVVSVIFVGGGNRASSVKYVVGASGGPNTIFVNQQSSDFEWLALGAWDFDAGEATVLLDAAGSSGGSFVIADAARFALQPAGPTPTPTPIGPPQSEEFRAIWVTGWGKGFKTASEVTELVSVVHEHNFNAILAEVRTRGDCYYFPTPPNLEPRAADIAPDFDPLQELIDQARPHGIEVHAWIVANNVAFASTTLDPAHVVNVHPEFLTKNSAGETQIGDSYFLDPGHPGAQQWNHNVVMDLVTNYDIDGIHYDYIRYPGRDSGYNDTALARYKAEFGECGAFFPPSIVDEQFRAWRRRQVTDWMRATYADIMAVKPQIKVTAAVFAPEESAVNGVYQDWPTWMKEHLLDAVIPMNYSDDLGVFHDRALNANAQKNGRHCYMGYSGYQNTLEGSAAQMLDARAMGCEGFALFQYLATNSTGTPNSEFYDYALDHVTTAPAAMPPMPWKTSPAGGYLRGRVTGAASDAPIYNATVSISELGKSVLADVDGNFAFIYLPAGSYSLQAEANGFTAQSNPNVFITAGQVTTENFALASDPAATPMPTPIPQTDIIVDNDGGAGGYHESGAWTTSASTGFNDFTYRYSTAGVDRAARWSAWLEAGEYEIFTIYRASPNRSTAAQFVVVTLAGDQSVAIDQTQNNFVWVSLGKFQLPEGCNDITLDAATSGTGIVIADAVRFVKVGPPLNHDAWKMH